MTEYEMAELVNAGIGLMLTGTGIYFAQLGSYLVVAWLIGDKLTRFQVGFLNLMLILLTFSGMANAITLLYKNFALINELRDLGSITVVSSSEQSGLAVTVFVTFRVVILLAALVFMWQIRHPKAA